jgi:hypothetical protein
MFTLRSIPMRSFLILVSFLLFASVLGANQNAIIREVGPATAERRVVLATEPTQFKDALIQEMVRLLNDGNTFIQVINHARNGLDRLDPREYNAVFITNSGATARVRSWVLNFLSRVSQYDQNVILHTTQTTVWTPPVKVDSITSASDMGAVRRLAQEMVDKIKKFF